MPTQQSIATRADGEREAQIPLAERHLPASTYDLLRLAGERYTDQIALQFLPQGRLDEVPVRVTYRDLLARITQTANLFHRLGLRKDDVVAYVLPNLLQTHLVLWGGEAAGIAGAVNPLLEPVHIAGILNAMRAKIVVTLGPESTGSGLWDKIARVLPQVPSLQTVLVVDPRSFTVPNWQPALPAVRRLGRIEVLDFDLERAREPENRLMSGRTIQPTELASVFHTGGTTGLPKLAPHTHANEVFMAWSIALSVALQEGSVFLCGLPLFHVNAILITGLAAWQAGAQVILAGPAGYRTPGLLTHFWQLIAKYRINYFSAVPTVYAALLDVPLRGADISSLQYAICGAAPLPPEVFRRFETLTGVKIVEGYGMTEGTCASAINPPAGQRRIGSIGFPLPYQQLRVAILDEQGTMARLAKTDEVGVLVMRGPQVFPGYLREPDNRGAWLVDREGVKWFNTGDLARVDADGYLWLVGRVKELIIRGGHNIDPQLIEEVLCQHPAVSLVAAVGQPDAHAGELPVAYVVLREGAAVSEAQLLAFAREAIAERAAVPVRIIALPHLPLTAVGKIFKPGLRYLAIDRVYQEVLAVQGIPADVKTGPDAQLGMVAEIRLAQPAQQAAAAQVLSGFTVPVRFVGAS